MSSTSIDLTLGVPNWTVYTRLRFEDGSIWNSTTEEYVDYIVANIGDFQLATPENPVGSGDYQAIMPVDSPAGKYTWGQYRRMGGTPAASDPLVGYGSGYWNGETFASESSLESQIVESASGLLPDFNAKVAIGLILDAACFGVLKNVETTSPEVWNPAGTIQRMTINVDENGNRVSIEVNSLPS